MDPVTGAAWRKSSHSNGSQQGSCVEVARHRPGLVTVRDSKDPAGPVLPLAPAGWQDFLADVKTGRYDLP